MMQKAVNAKAKINRKFGIMVQDTNSHYPKNYCPSQNTSAKMQIQSLTTKISKPKEYRPKEAKLVNSKSSALLQSNKVIKPNCQKKKKENWKKK